MVSQRLKRRVRKDFTASAADAALCRLERLNLPLAETQSAERIQAAIVLLAHSDIEQLEHYARMAERDWRDVLVFSGLGDGDWRTRLDDELGSPER